MDPFELPEELPAGVEELTGLRTAAQEAFTRLRDKHAAGEDLTEAELAELRVVAPALKVLDAAITAAHDEAEALASEIDGLFSDGDVLLEEVDANVEETEGEVEEISADDVEVLEPVTASSNGRREVTKFSRGGKLPARQPHIPRGTGSTENMGYRMTSAMPKFEAGLVSLRQIAEAIDSVNGSHRLRGNGADAGNGQANLTLFSIARSEAAPIIEDSHQLVAAINAATAADKYVWPTYNEVGALTAAGGWCAPSEQLYDFCAVPLATDLVSLPEITIRRGGVRWPVEPDLSAIFDSFEFFFTEPQLEALPPVVKNCVEIPCPDEFEEIRLNAVGYCVEAGILQTQGWPELIEWFMQSLTQEHLRALSRRTILDMVAGSTPISITNTSNVLGVSASSTLLNTLELMAVNLRLKKGLARGSLIEGVAPNWLHAVIRADFAMQEGLDIKSVTDAQINSWFSARGIAFQFVADWQTRGVGQPGDLLTQVWPGSVRVLLYPAGTWFRALSNVIEFGIQYPRELLQINRYTRFFTEDAYAVAKRCDDSLVVTVPLCPNGAYGAAVSVTCNAPANEVQSLNTTGTPTGGTFTLTFQGQTTAAIAYNAAAAAVQSALLALSNLDSGDVVAAGGAVGTAPVTLTFGGRFAAGDVPKITANGAALTGGTNPAAVITVTTEGGS